MAADNNVVKASPTKEFFVSMLVKDILLKQAIIELIDNSIDGARSAGNNHDFHGLFIDVQFTKDEFVIKDNCGGIPVDIASEYAFRFGRPSSSYGKGETTGIFGIGMKRALFKMGRDITIESKTLNSEFTVRINVDEWLADEKNWDFSFSHVNTNISVPREQTGTTITVRKLYPEISGELEDERFFDELIDHVQLRTGLDISSGMDINVNGVRLSGKNIQIINSDELKPVKDTYIDSSGVRVEIVAGIAPKGGTKYTPDNAGWYIYCNRRLIVAADKTSLTTWKDMENKNSDVSFHNTYAPFRGIVMFSSNNPALLPWNTTKTGIDATSLVYLRAKERMLEVFKIVKAFFDEVRAYEKENEDDGVEMSLASLSTTEITYTTIAENLQQNRRLSVQNIKINSNPNVRITYFKPKSEVEKIKASLGVKYNSEVGTRTFDYYMDAECD